MPAAPVSASSSTMVSTRCFTWRSVLFLCCALVIPVQLSCSTAHSASLSKNAFLVLAAAMVDMAAADGKISEDEEQLIAKRFPITGEHNPVRIFTLDRSNLPHAIAQLRLDNEQAKQVLAFLALVAAEDGKLHAAESSLLQRHIEAQQSSISIDEIIRDSRQLQLLLRHKGVVLHLKELVAAEQTFFQQNEFYISASPYPPRTSPRPATWDNTAANGFRRLEWQPTGKIFATYWVDTSKTSFKATAIIDADNDGEYATYVAAKDNPAPRRITEKNIQ